MKKRTGLKRGVTGGAMVALAGLLAALALVYSNASGITEVADAAREQQLSESALGAIGAARSALGQAIVLGNGDDPTLAAAGIGEAGLVVDAMTDRVTTLAATLDDPDALLAALDSAVASSKRVIDALAAGDVGGAGDLAAGSAGESFDLLIRETVEIRDERNRLIADAASEAGSVATASRFMVALVVPAFGVIIAFFMVRRERKRERLAAELKHERSLSKSKDQLIANLSHELRTPLTGIYTSALAIDEMADSDDDLAQELNSMIVDQAADLTRMVEDLLVSAQADAGRLTFDCRPTAVREQLEAVIREIERMGAEIELHMEDATVIADHGRLRQVLRNLLSNAVRHGGPSISVEGKIGDRDYELSVIDDGEGVPPEVAERMFQRFVHQGDRPLITGSVGLGLAITRVLAEGMGGTIEYRRDENRTRFTIALPLAEPEPEEEPDSTADAGVPDEEVPEQPEDEPSPEQSPEHRPPAGTTEPDKEPSNDEEGTTLESTPTDDSESGTSEVEPASDRAPSLPERLAAWMDTRLSKHVNKAATSPVADEEELEPGESAHADSELSSEATEDDDETEDGNGSAETHTEEDTSTGDDGVPPPEDTEEDEGSDTQSTEPEREVAETRHESPEPDDTDPESAEGAIDDASDEHDTGPDDEQPDTDRTTPESEMADASRDETSAALDQAPSPLERLAAWVGEQRSKHARKKAAARAARRRVKSKSATPPD